LSLARSAAPHAAYGLDEDRTLLGRIKTVWQELRELLPPFYSDICQTTTNPLADLPVWMDLDLTFQLRLSPTPSERVVSCVREADSPLQGLRSACQKLLQHRERPSGGDVVRELLERSSKWQVAAGEIWQDWLPLAMEFMRVVGPSQLFSVLSFVLRAYPKASFVTKALGLLLRKGGPAFQEPVLTWLKETSTEAPAWAATLSDVYEYAGRSADFDELALRFLSEQPDHGSWSFFWEYLLHGGFVAKSDLRRRALSWLGIPSIEQATFATISSPHVSGIDRVWQKLWADKAATSEERLALDAFARFWLEQVDMSFGGWRYVWQDLWDAPQTSEQRARLVGDGYRWLSALPGHPSWGWMWNQLWKEPAAEMLRPELATDGRQWLHSADKNEPSWGHVWTTLWGGPIEGETRAELALEGYRWLQSVDPEHGSWAYVWMGLWTAPKIPLHRSQLVSLGRQWLRSASINHGGWKPVWEPLWVVAKSTTDIQDMAIWGRRWLSANSKHGGWAYMWKALWRKPSSLSRVELAREGQKWLANNSTHRSAKVVRDALR
jgi:hypothetical protein